MKTIKWNGTVGCTIGRGSFAFEPGQERAVPDDLAERYLKTPGWTEVEESDDADTRENEVKEEKSPPKKAGKKAKAKSEEK